ncbi:MAG: hypothetical protein Q7R76_01620 [Candidatus Woesearchaeota archaeon]|nr:hypothetical protein [Candidatus Woesearchaeota archaeon]
MAKPKSKPAPSKKYSPDEVLERFRAKDDPELGRYAGYAASHRTKLAKVSEKEKARQEKEAQKEAEKKKQFQQAVTPEELYKDESESAIDDTEYEDDDMPSSDIKGKIFSNYQPLSSAPQPGTQGKQASTTPPPIVSPPKPSMRDLTRMFNQKFSDEKKEEEKKAAENKKEKAEKTPTKKVTKKLIKKTKTVHIPDAPVSPGKKSSAPPMPPAKKVDAKYVKQQQEALQKKQEQEEKSAEKKASADEAAKKEAEKPAATTPQPQSSGPHKRNPFRTGFWIACGIFAFLIILLILFIIAIAAIASITHVPLLENGTLVLP